MKHSPKPRSGVGTSPLPTTLEEGLEVPSGRDAPSDERHTPSMIERVARAICCPDGICRNAKLDPRYIVPMPCDEIMHRDESRAAMAAMREPIEEQMNAGIIVAGEHISNDEATALVVAMTYQRMIDAALAECDAAESKLASTERPEGTPPLPRTLEEYESLKLFWRGEGYEARGVENAALLAFAKDAISEFWTRDSADMQEYGVKHGLLVEVVYDPAKHGDVDDCEPGDNIFVYASWFKAALASTAERALRDTLESTAMCIDKQHTFEDGETQFARTWWFETEAARDAAALASPSTEGEKLWLWRDGKDRFLAFRSLFPTMPDGGDPATLGQPSGYAFYHPMTLAEAQAVSRVPEQAAVATALPEPKASTS